MAAVLEDAKQYEVLKQQVRTIPNYPKNGIMFRDITTLWQSPQDFSNLIEALAKPFHDMKINKVAAIEARGFVIGGGVAHHLSAGFVPLRKKGKLPWKVNGQNYQLEYGEDCLEIHQDAIQPDDNVLIIDDLIATGGTVQASIDLIRQQKGNIIACAFVIALPELGGIEKITAMGCKSFHLMTFDGH